MSDDHPDEDLRQIVGLITVMLDSNPGQRYICGHYTGEVRLIGDVTPAIVIWGHTVWNPIAPRVIDMYTAQRFRSLSDHVLDSIGIAGTEKVDGFNADWRVVLNDPEEADQ